jgi:hypothetical protein
MAEKETEKTEAEAGKLAVKTGAEKVPSVFEEAWHPLLSLRREMDRVFDDFFRFAAFPFGRRAFELEPFRAFEGMSGRRFRPSTSSRAKKSTSSAPSSPAWRRTSSR